MASLVELFDSFGQSPWIDNLQRSWLNDGTLANYIRMGVRGLTSNPSIFAHAISSGSDYSEHLDDLKGSKVDDVYWDLVLHDIAGACKVLRPLYEESSYRDGFVSVEVDPRLSHDSSATIEAAKRIKERVKHPNLLIKIPATKEGVEAVREVVAEGISVNVTLIFSLNRYREVMTAYIDGVSMYLEKGGSDIGHLASVASFFVSRTDVKVDALLSKVGADKDLFGKAAVASAKLAYQDFLEVFSSDTWTALAARGAQPQRPLWASTSTKNPEYSDLLYVDSLIGPNTVNTMPEATVRAYIDHGTPRASLLEGVEEAHDHLEQISALGIDLEEVALQLEKEGVAAFEQAHVEILDLLRHKMEDL